MDDKTAFKEAFLSRCKAAGLSNDEISGCLDRAIAAVQTKSAGLNSMLREVPMYAAMERGMGAMAESVPGLGIGAYFGIPLAAGAAGGFGLAKMRDLQDEDPAEIRTRESIDAYQRLAQRTAIRDRLRRLNRPTRSRSPLVR